VLPFNTDGRRMKSTRPNLFSRAARDCVPICAGQAALQPRRGDGTRQRVETIRSTRHLVNEIYFAIKQLTFIAVLAWHYGRNL
jgi:hypothetical protein